MEVSSKTCPHCRMTSNKRVGPRRSILSPRNALKRNPYIGTFFLNTSHKRRPLKLRVGLTSDSKSSEVTSCDCRASRSAIRDTFNKIGIHRGDAHSTECLPVEVVRSTSDDAYRFVNRGGFIPSKPRRVSDTLSPSGSSSAPTPDKLNQLLTQFYGTSLFGTPPDSVTRDLSSILRHRTSSSTSDDLDEEICREASPRFAPSSSRSEFVDRTDATGSTDVETKSMPAADVSVPEVESYGLLELESVDKRYKVAPAERNLGTGSFSYVQPAIHRMAGFDVALKRISKKMLFSAEEKNNVLREIQLHKPLMHPRIVRLHEAFETPAEVVIVLDRCDAGNLRQLIRKEYARVGGLVPQKDALIIIKQLLQGVSYLHSYGIVHSDIKPDNILFQTKATSRRSSVASDCKSPARKVSLEPFNIASLSLKICDLGLARKCPSSFNKKITGDPHLCPYSSNCGTRGYIAAELLRGEPYGIASDMWSVGVTLFEILFGYLPFHPAESALYTTVAFEPRYTSHVTADVKNLISQMLESDPKKRISAYEALSKPMFETL